jgi:hypothetical protein
MVGKTLGNPQRRIERLRTGDAIGVIDEQLVAPAPLRRADEQVAQGLDEGRAEHGASIGEEVQAKPTTSCERSEANWAWIASSLALLAKTAIIITG